jgi:C4-dicarboxylate transporter
MTAEEWVKAFAEKLGTPAPDAAEIEALLAMAATAAHASERTAAPVSTWLAARAGVSAAEALELAKALEDESGSGGG